MVLFHFVKDGAPRYTKCLFCWSWGHPIFFNIFYREVQHLFWIIFIGTRPEDSPISSFHRLSHTANKQTKCIEVSKYSFCLSTCLDWNTEILSFFRPYPNLYEVSAACLLPKLGINYHLSIYSLSILVKNTYYNHLHNPSIGYLIFSYLLIYLAIRIYTHAYLELWP